MGSNSGRDPIAIPYFLHSSLQLLHDLPGYCLSLWALVLICVWCSTSTHIYLLVHALCIYYLRMMYLYHTNHQPARWRHDRLGSTRLISLSLMATCRRTLILGIQVFFTYITLGPNLTFIQQTLLDPTASNSVCNLNAIPYFPHGNLQLHATPTWPTWVLLFLTGFGSGLCGIFYNYPHLLSGSSCL